MELEVDRPWKAINAILSYQYHRVLSKTLVETEERREILTPLWNYVEAWYKKIFGELHSPEVRKKKMDFLYEHLRSGGFRDIEAPEVEEEVEPEDKREVEGVKLIRSYEDRDKTVSVSTFVSLYVSRLNVLKEVILKNHPGIRRPILIEDLDSFHNVRVQAIGLVTNYFTYNTGTMAITLEDPSGIIKCVVPASRREEKEEITDLVESGYICKDDVICIDGVRAKKGDALWVENIIFPDVRELDHSWEHLGVEEVER